MSTEIGTDFKMAGQYTGGTLSRLIPQLSGLLLKHYWIGIFSILFIRYASRKYFSPLKDVPGPFLASMSRLWKVMTALRSNFHIVQLELHKKYGPVVRIAPNEVSFSSSSAARTIYAVGKGFDKTDFYDGMGPFKPTDIFTETDEKLHAAKRRMASSAYSHSSVIEMEHFVDDTGKAFFQRLDEEFVRTGKACNFSDWLQYYAFDVLGELVFSHRFGFLQSGTDADGLIKLVESVFAYVSTIAQAPILDKFLLGNPLVKLIIGPPQQKVATIAMSEIQMRESGSLVTKDRNDLLSRILAASKNNAHGLGTMDVFSIAQGAIFAGSDSTAISLQAIIYHVLATPRVHALLMTEINDAAAAGNLSNPVSYAQGIKLPYLQAVMKEAMRLHPAVGVPMPRHVPKGGAEIEGRWYPGGTRVGVNAWVVHMDRVVFGADADVFRPERFLEEEGRARERSLLHFGAGSHVCIGKNISLLEMTKLVPQLFRTYEMELVEPKGVLATRCDFFVKHTGLNVRLRRRDGV